MSAAVIGPLLGMIGAALIGLLVDRGLVRMEPIAARWPVRVLLGVVAIYLALALPVFGVLAVAALLATRSRGAPAPSPSRLDSRTTLLVLAGIAVLVALRPPTLLYWDEYVWLAKARLGSPDPRALVAESLTAGTQVVPIAYPLLHPLAVSSLAGFRATEPSLVLGAETLTVCAAAAFALTALESDRKALGLAAALGAAPLAFIHLRSAYVDLETGMIAAAIFLLVERRQLRAASVLAVAVVGLKDEGLPHLFAVTAPFLISAWRKHRRVSWAALVPLAAGGASFAAWHIRILIAGVSQQTDHVLGLPKLSRFSLVLSLLARQASDVVSWGPLWIVVAGLLLASALRFVALDVSARPRLAALGLQALFLFGAIIAGSDRVGRFATSGTLVPRMLVQLAPMAILLLASVLLSERAARPRSPESPRAS